jgi:prenyltransferase beta subunit
LQKNHPGNKLRAMSLRLEMLQVARLAPNVLGESEELVRKFLLSERNEDGAFRDRKAASDLYYTAFGLDALCALRHDIADASVRRFIQGYNDGATLDFVHLCCLARCWTALSQPHDCDYLEIGEKIALRLQKFRSRDGGFNIVPGAPHGSSYAAFLGLGAHQDLRITLPDPEQLAESVKALGLEDGSYSNDRMPKIGATNSTAAAVATLRSLSVPLHPKTGEWLLAQAQPTGGFRAVPGAPIPDLLSTATALHALSSLEIDFSSIKERTLDFVDSLWTNKGSFHGNWTEDTLDCEYTFYGLLALGHLSY